MTYSHSLNKNIVSDLFYDIYNNLAKIHNAKGDIERSLEFLFQALDCTRYFQTLNAEKVKDISLATILPELFLNISGA